MELYEQEIIKDIEGYEGIYAVTNFGRVWSYLRKVKTFKNRNRVIGSCWVNAIKNGSGYLQVNLSVNGKRKISLIHRLVAKAFILNPDNKPTVNHKDGNKQNNHISNLEWATQQEQVIHSYENKLQIPKRGADHPCYGKKPPNYIPNKPPKIKKPPARTMLGKHGKDHPNSKPVYAFTDDNEIHKEFENILIASKELSVCPSSIGECCSGKRKSAGKYNNKPIRWKFLPKI